MSKNIFLAPWASTTSLLCYNTLSMLLTCLFVRSISLIFRAIGVMLSKLALAGRLYFVTKVLSSSYPSMWLVYFSILEFQVKPKLFLPINSFTWTFLSSTISLSDMVFRCWTIPQKVQFTLLELWSNTSKSVLIVLSPDLRLTIFGLPTLWTATSKSTILPTSSSTTWATLLKFK